MSNINNYGKTYAVGGGQLHVIFLDRKMKMNREAYNIIILGSGSLLDLLFYGMEISNYSFNICGIYDEKDEILSYRGIVCQIYAI